MHRAQTLVPSSPHLTPPHHTAYSRFRPQVHNTALTSLDLSGAGLEAVSRGEPVCRPAHVSAPTWPPPPPAPHGAGARRADGAAMVAPQGAPCPPSGLTCTCTSWFCRGYARSPIPTQAPSALHVPFLPPQGPPRRTRLTHFTRHPHLLSPLAPPCPPPLLATPLQAPPQLTRLTRLTALNLAHNALKRPPQELLPLLPGLTQLSLRWAACARTRTLRSVRCCPLRCP